jgi:pimeloyl-ACP methyl ester carboxylesterase
LTAGSLEEAVMDLAALCDALGLERAYLAGYASGGQTALHFALRHPNRLEGLVLIGPDRPWLLSSQEAAAAKTRHAIEPSPVPGTQHPVLTMPTLLVAGEQSPTQVAWARRFAAQWSRAALGVIAGAGDAPQREHPLQVGHEMVRFLLQCERQRTLVRGASFLL